MNVTLTDEQIEQIVSKVVERLNASHSTRWQYPPVMYQPYYQQYPYVTC